jgi:Flp pilus assembly protein TadG
MILVVGGAVDYARMIQYRASLQNAVDQAAIAGAAVFSVPSQSALATQVATNYFNRTILPSSLSITAPTVSTNSSGTINPALGSAAAYTVTVSATAKVSTTLLSLVIPSATITATGTAGDPVVAANLTLGHVNSRACDGNSVYLYEVPLNSSGNGYDYSSVPAWTTPAGLPTNNYYMIGSSYQTVPAGQVMPAFSANQPLGVALVNKTDGNTTTGNTNCGVAVMGANSYGAPLGQVQYFYSSLLLNNQSPSEIANTSYTVTVITSNSWLGSSITNVYNGTTPVLPLATGSYNTLSTYLGINAPGSGHSNCTSTSSTSILTTTTVYTCSATSTLCPTLVLHRQPHFPTVFPLRVAERPMRRQAVRKCRHCRTAPQVLLPRWYFGGTTLAAWDRASNTTARQVTARPQAQTARVTVKTASTRIIFSRRHVR